MPSSQAPTQTRRTGSAEPRVRVCPKYVNTYGPHAAALAEAYAYPLFPWQVDVLDDWLGRDKEGKPVAITIGLSVPRQNGKNYIIEVFEVFVAAVLGWHVLHTAHEVKTSMKSFMRVCSYFDGPSAKREMHALVERIRRTNGKEMIVLTNGGCIEFSARSRQAARGFDDIQVVVFDEAQELVQEQVDAIMATLSASSTGTRQIIYTGTPTPPTSTGTVFAKVRAQALKGELAHCVYHEWGVTECPDATARFSDVVDDVYATNPSMGITLDEEFTMQEFAVQTVDGFARERLGWWVSLQQNCLIAEEDLMRCAITDVPSMDGELHGAGVKFAVDGSSAALAVATRYPNDVHPPHVELISIKSGREGVMWLADWLDARRDTLASVAIDGLYGRDVLLDELNHRKFPKKAMVAPQATEVSTAASMLKERIDTGRVTWYEEQERLRLSALSSERRAIGNKGAWGFGGSDPCPIEACSLALWGVMTTKRNPNRKLRVG